MLPSCAVWYPAVKAHAARHAKQGPWAPFQCACMHAALHCTAGLSQALSATCTTSSCSATGCRGPCLTAGQPATRGATSQVGHPYMTHGSHGIPTWVTRGLPAPILHVPSQMPAPAQPQMPAPAQLPAELASTGTHSRRLHTCMYTTCYPMHACRPAAGVQPAERLAARVMGRPRRAAAAWRPLPARQPLYGRPAHAVVSAKGHVCLPACQLSLVRHFCSG